MQIECSVATNNREDTKKNPVDCYGIAIYLNNPAVPPLLPILIPIGIISVGRYPYLFFPL
jgi:hypothetical protein